MIMDFERAEKFCREHKEELKVRVVYPSGGSVLLPPPSGINLFDKLTEDDIQFIWIKGLLHGEKGERIISMTKYKSLIERDKNNCEMQVFVNNY